MSARRRLRRTGCGLLLLLWFALLIIIPCGAFTLLTQSEIVITRSSIPDNSLRIWMVQDADQRGIGVANGYTVKESAEAVCTATDIQFFLWKGKANSNHNCTCYAKQGDGYTITSDGAEACQIAGK